MDRPVQVLVIGDSEMTREGLTRLLRDSGFVAQSWPEDTALLNSCPTVSDLEWIHDASHLVVVDIRSGARLVETCRELRRSLPDARIVAIGDEREDEVIRAAFFAGANGFCPRIAGFLPLVHMLKLVALGEKIAPTAFIDELLRRNVDDGTLSKSLGEVQLSQRETHILRCLVEGDANKVIARKLGIAEATVKAHIKGILRKLNVLNRTQAAIWLINRTLAAGGIPTGSTLQ